MLRALALLVASGLAAGCLAPTSPAQKLTDNAIEMNTALQFGRMDIAGDYVAATARAVFVREHAAWGKTVRIVDLEYAGFQMKEGDQADVFVNVSWQTLADPNMHETRVVQHWKGKRGSWTIDSETTEGDPGLLGGPGKARAASPPPAPDAPPSAADAATPPLPTVELAPKRNRYQTRVIYDD
jgi:hypothetical protein